MPCSSNFTTLYKLLYLITFITSPFLLKIGTTMLVFHSSGIPFPPTTRWQRCSITSSAILPPATIISVVTSDSLAGFPCYIFLIASLPSLRETFSTGLPTIAASTLWSQAFSSFIILSICSFYILHRSS